MTAERFVIVDFKEMNELMTCITFDNSQYLRSRRIYALQYW